MTLQAQELPAVGPLGALEPIRLSGTIGEGGNVIRRIGFKEGLEHHE